MPISDYIQMFNFARPQVGPIVFDGTLQEDHGIEIDVTEEPVEEGGLVADHRIVRPRALKLVGVLLAFPDSILPPFSFSRHVTLWKRLVQLATLGDLHDVITTLEIHTAMTITYVRTVKGDGGRNANGLDVEVGLRKFEFARIDVAQQIADAAQDLALGQAELGAQGTLAQASAELAALGVF